MDKTDSKEQYEVFDKGSLEGAFVKAPILVLFDERLTHSNIHCYLTLKSFAWRGSCFPGLDTLANQGGVSCRTVMRHIDVLEEIGLVTVERTPGVTNRYVLELMADVYYESLDPPRLRQEYADSLRKRGLVRVVERALDIEIGEGDAPEEEVRDNVKDLSIRRMSGRTQSLLGSFKSVEEKAQEARERKDHNAKKRKKHNATAEKPADVDHLVDSESKPINAADVEAIWRDVAAELWPNTPGMRSKWGGENMGIAKKLVEKWTGETVVRCVEHILRNWPDFQERYRVNNRPLNMKLIAYFADSWFPEIEEGKKMSMPSRREKALQQGEYKGHGKANGKGKGVEFLFDD